MARFLHLVFLCLGICLSSAFGVAEKFAELGFRAVVPLHVALNALPECVPDQRARRKSVVG